MPADHGTDVGGFEDLDSIGSMVSGRRCLAEAIARRITTPRGMLIDNPDYGYDVRYMLLNDYSTAEMAAEIAAIEAECKKDERVVDASAAWSFSVSGELLIALSITDGEGPFRFVLQVGEATAEVIGV